MVAAFRAAVLVSMLLSVSGSWTASSWPAGGMGTVVFASDRTGKSAVYAVDPANGELAQVAAADAETPVPAPDGTAVAYTSTDNSGWSVLVARPGAAPSRLPGCGLSDNSGSWSPDGTSFACAQQRETFAPTAIEVSSADGATSRVVASGDFDDPAWSPDGAWIAFESPCACSQGGVWVAPAAGGAVRHLTTLSAYGPLAWSPDSTRLAFVGGSVDSPNELYEIGVTGARPRLLARNVGDRSGYFQFLGAAWSSDARRIVVGSERGLVVVDAASGVTRMLTRDRGESPAWSPDGSQIAYLVPRTRSESSWDVAVIRANGAGRRFLTSAFPDGGSNVGAAWSTAPLVDPLVRPALHAIELRPTRSTALPAAAAFLTTQGAHAVLSTTGGCNLWRWDPGEHPVRIPACDTRDACNQGPDATALLADLRLAWTCFESGLNQYENIRLAAPPYRNDHHQVAFLYADDTGGNRVGTMLAGGARLLFEIDTVDDSGNVTDRSSYVLDPRRQRGPACPDDGGTETGGHTKGCRPLAAVTNCALLDAAPAAIVARCPNGLIRVLDGAGRPIQDVPTSTEGAAASSDGTHLLVLDGLSLRQYDLRTGAPPHSHSLPADIIRATLVGGSPRYAAYVRGTAIHLVRIADGADLPLRLRHVAGSVVARLDDAGLFYGYESTQGRKAGTVGFLSTASIGRLFASVAAVGRDRQRSP